MNSSLGKATIAPRVFVPSALVIAGLLAFSSAAPDAAAELFGNAKQGISEHLGGLFRASVTVFLVFVLGVMFSRYGQVRLGPDDARPEFSRITWLSMLFSAGMGIGLMFFSVAEPMIHLAQPPEGVAHTDESARAALGLTMFHWGLHAWAVYTLMGLALSYFAYRRGLPLAIRSIFHPLLGERIRGTWGDAVDVLAVLGTVFGLATSLGLGAKQINAGLHHLFDTPDNAKTQIVIIVMVTCAATASLASGLQRGVRRLSELNLVLASSLLLVVFAFGPTSHVLSRVPADVWAYAKNVGASFSVDGHVGSDAWQANWSVFYWAWWIAWAPFVGTFVARISKGRTIREFVLGVLLVPTMLTMVWLLVFGETAMFLERNTGANIVEAVEANSALAIYQVLQQLPMPALLSGAAVVTVVVFFVTSSDSGSLVVDMLTSGGHPDPAMWQRLLWATTEGVVAVVLLWVGGLGALQSAAIVTGLPFCFVLLMACYSLWRALRAEPQAS